jgi:hypothetical protein
VAAEKLNSWENLVLVTLVVIFILFFLRNYFAPPILDVETAVWLIWSIVASLSAVAFYIGKGNILFGIGLFMLAIAFFSSLLVTVGTIGEEWRVVIALEANPSSYVQWTRYVLIYGILPVAVGIAFCVVGYMVRRKTSTGNFRSLLLLITGGFFVVWGIRYFQVAYGDYSKALSWAVESGVNNINNELQAIYLAYECLSILLLVAGIFLSFTSFYYLYKQGVIKSIYESSNDQFVWKEKP